MNRWNQILDFDSQVCRRGLRRNDSILRLNVLSFYMKRNLAGGNLDSKLPPVICGDPLFSASGSGNYGRAGEDFIFWADNHTGNRAAWRKLRLGSKSSRSDRG